MMCLRRWFLRRALSAPRVPFPRLCSSCAIAAVTSCSYLLFPGLCCCCVVATFVVAGLCGCVWGCARGGGGASRDCIPCCAFGVVCLVSGLWYGSVCSSTLSELSSLSSDSDFSPRVLCPSLSVSSLSLPSSVLSSVSASVRCLRALLLGLLFWCLAELVGLSVQALLRSLWRDGGARSIGFCGSSGCFGSLPLRPLYMIVLHWARALWWPSGKSRCHFAWGSVRVPLSVYPVTLAGVDPFGSSSLFQNWCGMSQVCPITIAIWADVSWLLCALVSLGLFRACCFAIARSCACASSSSLASLSCWRLLYSFHAAFLVVRSLWNWE